MDSTPHGVETPEARRQRRRQALEWLGAGLIVVLLIGGRITARYLPPDGVLRTRVGPAIGFTVGLAMAITASVAGWGVWRGGGKDPYRRSILPKQTTDRLTLALPSIAVAWWGLYLAVLLGTLFIDDANDQARYVSEAVAAALFLPPLVIALVFALFAYTASRWRWPRFVLPAADRHAHSRSNSHQA